MPRFPSAQRQRCVQTFPQLTLCLITISVFVLVPQINAVANTTPEDSAECDDCVGIRWRDLSVSAKSSVRPTVSTSRTRMGSVEKPESGDEMKGSDSTTDVEEAQYLLRPSSGFVQNGHICGIIGPSGSGKTTLLAALGGTTLRSAGLKVSGSVWLDEAAKIDDNVDSANPSGGNTTKKYLSARDGEVAILQQNDAFFSMLSPRETVDLAAFLQLDSNSIGPTGRRIIVERTLDSLGLTAVEERRIGDRAVGDHGRGGGLSGGERRRLSVALELITEPKIFLADEPTTGLDSSQAGKVVNLISRLAKERNIPVLCSLHQPRASIWKTLDSFILLAPGGKVCYIGERKKSVKYFAKLGYECPSETNPAEFFIDLVSVDTEDPVQAAVDNERIQHLSEAFTKVQQEQQRQLADSDGLVWLPPSGVATTPNKNNNNRGKGRMKLSFLKRSGRLFHRSWRQNIRNGRVNALRLGASVGQALLFSSIFKTVKEGKSLAKSIADRTALLSFGVINMSMMALMKTLDLFGREKVVVRREQTRNQYTSFEYLLAKVLAEIPLDTCFAAVFATLLKYTTNLRTSLVRLSGTFSLMTVAGASLGFAIGGMTSNVESAMATGVPVMVILMIVGVINPGGVDVNDPPPWFVQLLKKMSPIRWAIEALCVAEYRGMEFGGSKTGGGEGRRRWRMSDLPKMGGLALVQNGDQVLDALGLGSATYEGLMVNLALLSGFNLVVSWLGLHFGGSDFVEATEVRQEGGNGKKKRRVQEEEKSLTEEDWMEVVEDRGRSRVKGETKVPVVRTI